MIQEKTDPGTLSWPVIAGLRVLWLALFVVLLAIFMAGIQPRFVELSEVCRAEPCMILTIGEEEATALAQLGLSTAAYAIYHITIEVVLGGFCALLAVLFFWRRFDEPMGILVAFMVMLFGLNFMVELDSAFVHSYPRLLMAQNYISSLTTIPLLLLIFLFPDGRFVPRWTRFIGLLIITLAVIDPLLNGLWSPTASGQFSYPFTIFVLISAIIGIGTQVYRFRTKLNPSQKQQTKWVIFGFMALMVPLFGWTFLIELFPFPPGLSRLFVQTIVYGVMAFFLMLFPLSFVVAITRYRLWDIDLIIRRTLVYAVLTGSLLLVYFGSVVVVQTAVNGLTGQEQSSQLTIALSTLLIAALFNPLRRRTQSFIDRRFYRRKYDAAQTLAQFAQTARDEVDMELLSAKLLSVIDEAMQPDEISFWLKN